MTLAAIFLALTMWGQPCVTYPGSVILCNPVQTDLIDVSAIQVFHHGERECKSNQYATIICSEPDPTWTCADKSRILLTAEDGSKHCIKF